MDSQFVYLILELVEEIPRGKVATYGQIATMAGYPRNARMVGKVLSCANFFGNYPCHRVVNHQGRLAPCFSEQKRLLKEENIIFKENGCVDLKSSQWKI